VVVADALKGSLLTAKSIADPHAHLGHASVHFRWVIGDGAELSDRGWQK
jgi:hypothetical protein